MTAPPAAPGPSTRIGGRYLLEERIGAGAMGAVWRATDELLGRAVAVKELLTTAVAGAPDGEGPEQASQRIMREGRIGARLQHAHVISMFDVVLHDGRPWLVMEYLPSRSLAAVLAERGPMPPQEVAEIGRQVADGLAAAHAAGVVHRDVKPGNVLIATDGRVKITDFGVSRAVDDVQITRTGLIAGTPAFFAPEVARGRVPTAAADVFSLGATLYTAVEGRPPFGLEDNAYALLHRVATGQVDPPRRAGPLTALLMRLLAAEPADRPTAAEARDALSSLTAVGVASPGAPTATAVRAPGTSRLPYRPAAPPPATITAPPPVRRQVPVAVVLLALLLVAGVVTGALVLSRGGAPDPPPQASPASPGLAPAPAPDADGPVASRPPTAAPAPPAGAAEQFVRSYYALLPRDTDAAWARLSDQARSRSGGRGGFDAFYGRFESVHLENLHGVADDTVEAIVVFDPFDGAGTREPYRFVIGEQDGRTVMVSFARL